MALADSLGQIFSLPEYQAPGVGRGGVGRGAAPATMDDKYFGIPEAPSGLQYTDHVAAQSQKLYQDWSDLRNFATSMWSMYGIDVRKPDPTRPESIAANQAFQQALANVMYQGDLLKQSGTMASQLAPMFAAGTTRPTDQFGQAPLAQQLPQQAYQFAGLSEPSEKLLGAVNQSFESGADKQRAYEQGAAYVASLRQRAAQDPTNATQLLREAQDVENAILPRTNITYPPRDVGGKENSSIFEFLKRASAVIRGASDYKISEVFNDPNTGQPLSTTKEFNDAFEGIDRKSGREAKGLIQEILKNPATGQMYLKLSTQEDLIPVSGTELIYGISKANPKYPGVDKITRFVGEVGGSNDVGDIDPNFFLNQQAINKAQEQQNRIIQESTPIAQKDQELIGLINGSAQGNWFTRAASFDTTTPPITKLDGITVDFQRDNAGNILLDSSSDKNVRSKLKSLGLTNDEISKQMSALKTADGFFKFLKKYGGQTTVSNISPDTQKAEELINKYLPK